MGGLAQLGARVALTGLALLATLGAGPPAHAQKTPHKHGGTHTSPHLQARPKKSPKPHGHQVSVTPTPTPTPTATVTKAATPPPAPVVVTTPAPARVVLPRTVSTHVPLTAPSPPAPRPRRTTAALPADHRDHRDDSTLGSLATFARAAQDNVKLPAGVLLVVVVFLLVQYRIDRRDPKLRMAAESSTEELEFGLPRNAPAPRAPRTVPLAVRAVRGSVAPTSTSPAEGPVAG